MIIIAKAGLGSAFDELALNKSLCDQMGVKIRGVILNRVFEDKREQTVSYLSRALEKWNIPLIGAIPYSKMLSTPSMEDFEALFGTKLISGTQYLTAHFENIRLVATSVDTFLELTIPHQLIVTPATREDIITALIEKAMKKNFSAPQYGVILTGIAKPTPSLLEKLKRAELPSLYAPYSSYDTMRMINSYIAKIRKDDFIKIHRAIELVNHHLTLEVSR